MVELQEAEVTEHVETPEAPLTAGSLLRQAREAAGMHVSTLAEQLKVPAAKLQALEADDWQKLPDAVFTRSLALSICKALQVDAAPVMAQLPKAASAQKFTAPGAGINARVRSKAVPSVHDTPSQGSAWKLLALVLLAGAGGGAWYFAHQQEMGGAVVASVQEQTASDTPVAQPVQPLVVPAAEPAAEPVAPEPAAAAAPAAAAPEPATAAAPEVAAAASAATLRIQVRAETWIQVRATGGRVLEQKTLQAGDVFETQAPRPLSVVVGRADAAEVQLGGAAFDLASVARENVARFEVK